MSEFKVQMPKMGESVQEATITKWFVKEGDKVEEDNLLFEIATEKVDSEIPSPVDGVISKILFEVDSVVDVGETVAIIKIDGEDDDDDEPADDEKSDKKASADEKSDEKTSPDEKPDEKTSSDEKPQPVTKEETTENDEDGDAEPTRFYSPLVRSIAKEDEVSVKELESIDGSGENGRVQKKDILAYIEDRKSGKTSKAVEKPAEKEVKQSDETEKLQKEKPKVSVSVGAEDQIVEMDRVRKLIADHMVQSAQSAPHVTSVVEADVTNLVLWRNKVKDEFQKKYNEKITFMPVFTEAVAAALREFPMVNASVDGDKMILRGKVNVGIAVAKPDGNLIVPVIRDADQKNLVGLTSSLNDLADRARNNKLSPDEITGGTFSITNFGSFRNIIGTPIINQPQVAILATGSIEKKPAVMETPTGDAIVVRHKMFLSLSYDHRIVDGAMGGAFLRKIADILEEFDVNRKI
ncbi:MAG: dihydrolipoamide acetyltransferase family protein [Prolixibacteraceae bacterium]|nr:dihydrolipoamide acetyltransferase family protein [Prolixibacteraceae bacterium]